MMTMCPLFLKIFDIKEMFIRAICDQRLNFPSSNIFISMSMGHVSNNDHCLQTFLITLKCIPLADSGTGHTVFTIGVMLHL